ncbi:MAG: DUF1499 domain-containing protein [Methylococcales bacterium]
MTDRIRKINLYACSLALCLALMPMQAISQPENNKVPAMNSKTLPRCPDSPNCVSSQADAGKHFVEPLVYAGSGQVAFAKLKETIANLPDTRIVQSGDSYLRAEFRTRWLKFTDDFEAILDERQAVIHIRSASRVGYWDLGTNRKRIESIRALMPSRVE